MARTTAPRARATTSARDVEALTGGQGDDVLIGDDDANRLIAYGGQDVLRGGAGPDQLYGWDDGDELDPGPGRDRCRPGRTTARCSRTARSTGSIAAARAGDRGGPGRRPERVRAGPVVRRGSRIRCGRPARIAVRCPIESALPCRGRPPAPPPAPPGVAARQIHFGPIEPGDRAIVRPRVPRPAARKGSCLSRQGGDAPLRRSSARVTVSRGGLFCLPSLRLRSRPPG